MEYLIFKFGMGVGMLLLATHAFVKLIVRIPRGIKLSPFIIGATVVAVGTSLPENVGVLVGATAAFAAVQAWDYVGRRADLGFFRSVYGAEIDIVERLGVLSGNNLNLVMILTQIRLFGLTRILNYVTVGPHEY